MKYLFLVCLSLLLTGCETKDENYYLKNPVELEEVLKKCPTEHPPQVSCDKLAQIVMLGHELGKNPQQFGRRILSLQETIAQQKAQLANASDKGSLEQSIQENEAQLAQLLVVVKWLESPES